MFRFHDREENFLSITEYLEWLGVAQVFTSHEESILKNKSIFYNLSEFLFPYVRHRPAASLFLEICGTNLHQAGFHFSMRIG